MGIAFVPLYASTLGTAAYGLVGIYAILQAAMTLLDFGLTPTLNREMALLHAGVHTPAVVRNLLRSLEGVCMIIASSAVLGTYLGAPWLATHWIKSTAVPQAVVVESFRVMGFVLAARWMEQVYRGALLGLHDVIWLNTVQAILATARWGGAYLVVARVMPTTMAFFMWQAGASVVTVGVLLRRTYRILPRSDAPARFNLAALRSIRSFAGGMFVSAILSFMLTQADKFIVGTTLSLEQLGFYTMASNVASGLLQLIVPMNAAVYPRFTDLAARGKDEELAQTYLQACQLLASIIIPPALVLAFFPVPTLMLWTENTALSKSVAIVLPLLALGTLFNGMMNLPYMMQLAFGWTSLAVGVNVVAVGLMIPGLIWAVPRYGAAGAAGGWLLLNAGYVCVVAHIMHRRLLPRIKWRWYRAAVVYPLAGGAVAGAGLRMVLPSATNRLSAALTVGTSLAVIALCVGLAMPMIRRTIWGWTIGFLSVITHDTPR